MHDHCIQYNSVVNKNVKENVGNVLVNGNRRKLENVQDMSGCSVDQKVKYTAGSFVGKTLNVFEAGHAAYTDRFHELARLVPHLVTPKSRKIERYIYGLAPQIRVMVALTKLKTMQISVHLSPRGHLAKDCRGVSRNVNPVNARNPSIRAWYECGSTDHVRKPKGTKLG
ncbi:hypothetical protein Tco_0542251 [Tanacetum coccineum]